MPATRHALLTFQIELAGFLFCVPVFRCLLGWQIEVVKECGAFAAGELAELSNTINSSGNYTGKWTTTALYLPGGAGCGSGAPIRRHNVSANTDEYHHTDLFRSIYARFCCSERENAEDTSCSRMFLILTDRFDCLSYTPRQL